MSLLWKNLLWILFVTGPVAVYSPLLLARGRPMASGPVLWLALAALGAGAAGYVWCVWHFATFGRGTPALVEAPKRLVRRGLYRVTRNPMYVSLLTVLLGWTLLFRSATLLVYTLVLGACFHAFIVLYEEPHLAREFGGEYDAYRAQVGRWLPRFRRRAAGGHEGA